MLANKTDAQASLERIQNFEEAFARIRSATGIEDIEELVSAGSAGEVGLPGESIKHAYLPWFEYAKPCRLIVLTLDNSGCCKCLFRMPGLFAGGTSLTDGRTETVWLAARESPRPQNKTPKASTSTSEHCRK